MLKISDLVAYADFFLGGRGLVAIIVPLLLLFLYIFSSHHMLMGVFSDLVAIMLMNFT